MSSLKAPWGLRWRSSTLFITSTVGIGLFTDLFLYGLVVPILPFMLRDRIDLPQAQIQSYVSALLAAYAGASVLSSLPAGILADRTSTRQLPFLAGLVAQLVATLMLLLGQNIPVLVIARMLQGVSAAVVWTIGLALVLDTVGPENLGKTIGSVCLALGFQLHTEFFYGTYRKLDFWLHLHWRARSASSRWRRIWKVRLWRRFRSRICYTCSRFHHAVAACREKSCGQVHEIHELRRGPRTTAESTSRRRRQ